MGSNGYSQNDLCRPFIWLNLDKSTIDALLCNHSSTINVAIALKEYSRVLKPGGGYCLISYGSPDARQSMFESEHLGFKFETILLSKKHFMYVCTKTDDADANFKANYLKVVEQMMKEIYEIKY